MDNQYTIQKATPAMTGYKGLIITNEKDSLSLLIEPLNDKNIIIIFP